MDVPRSRPCGRLQLLLHVIVDIPKTPTMLEHNTLDQLWALKLHLTSAMGIAK